MRERNFFPEVKSRLGYIEGRPDLFETKVLQLVQRNEASDKNNTILTLARDPGSGNALVPVLQELAKDSDTNIVTITDGWAGEILRKNFPAVDITPTGGILGADQTFDAPKVILMDFASSEMGLDTYASATFSEIPKILVEDYYGTAVTFLSVLIKRKLPLPEKICVMDAGARDIILKEFPDLADKIEVTGQPIFDQLTKENTEKVAQETKKKLGLQPTDVLIAFMSTIDEPEKIMQMADALKNTCGNFYLAFRRHPRDNTSYDTYKKILVDAGIKVIDTEGFTTNEIGAASDVVITTWSTEGLNGIYRRKPTIHVVDQNFRMPTNLSVPLVPVKLGASIGLENMSGLIEVLPKLLDQNSPTNKALQKNMEKNYPADGKNAKRVADVVRQYM